MLATAPPAMLSVDPSSASPSPGSGKKKVLLRRTLPKAYSTSSIDPGSPTRAVVEEERKQVLLARKIAPGQTIQLKSQANATVRMPDQGEPELCSESMVSPGSHGPAYDGAGELQGFSLLGPVDEFQEMLTASGAEPSVSFSGGASQTAPASFFRTDVLADGYARGPLARAQEREKTLRSKGQASLERAAVNAEALKARQRATWQHQEAALVGKMQRPPDSLVMSSVASYRTHVLSRMRNEALQRRKNPIGEREWMTKLRGGDTYFHQIGSPFNGIFCPVK